MRYPGVRLKSQVAPHGYDALPQVACCAKNKRNSTILVASCVIFLGAI